MSHWLLSYTQSPRERFDTNTNERVEAALTVVGARVTGTSGGSMITADYDDPSAADCQFEFAADEVTALRARDHIQAALLDGRDIVLEPAD